jgi:hypothetical protein
VVRVQIHLLDGFEEDDVRVRVAGAEQRLTEVSTGRRVGFARTLDVAVATEEVTVDVALPRRGLASTVVVAHASEECVQASIDESGELRLITSRLPPPLD